MGAPAASLVMPFGLGVAGLAALGLAGFPAGGGGGAFLADAGAALGPHKLTKSSVVPLVVSMKHTGTFTRGFDALGKSVVPGMGRLKAASAISGVRTADRATVIRNNLISVSSNIERYLL